MIELTARIESWPMKEPFRIAGRTFDDSQLLVVTIRSGGLTGRGEAAGVFYRDDLPPVMLAQIEGVRRRIEAGIERAALRSLLPPGGARCAIDCALWELEAKRKRKPVWELAGLPVPRALRTTYTLSAADPASMAHAARQQGNFDALKLKLVGDGQDAARVRAVRVARSDVWLGVDANQSLTRQSLVELIPTLRECDVRLIEQPLPVGLDGELDGLDCPIDIAADESVQSLRDLDCAARHYDVINIKLDKCGGLTEALLMADAARQSGLRIMVGNMAGTVLSMAPAYLLGQLCDVVDLDGPLLLARDRSPPALYEHGRLICLEGAWGQGSSN